MIFDTQNRKNTLLGAIVCVLCAFILLFTPFLTKTTFAANDYISNISFYTDANGVVRIKFFVNTSFDITIGAKAYCSEDFCKCLISGETSFADTRNPDTGILKSHNIAPINNPNDTLTCDTTFYFTAGNTYDNIWHAGNYVHVQNTTEEVCVGQCAAGYNMDYRTYWGVDPTSIEYETNIFKGGNWPQPPDEEIYYFTEYPSLTMAYPFDEAEIATAFSITGSYTLPVASTLDKLMAYFGYDI
ncbi:unnamed protein product, partial [marine sediment metagenome]